MPGCFYVPACLVITLNALLLHSILGQLADPRCAAASRLVLLGRSQSGLDGGEKTSGYRHNSQPKAQLYHQFTNLVIFKSLLSNYYALNVRQKCLIGGGGGGLFCRRPGGLQDLTSCCTGQPGCVCSCWKPCGSASPSFFLYQNALCESLFRSTKDKFSFDKYLL